ncbi:carboxylesterase family protein [Novosphingobium sp. 11B]
MTDTIAELGTRLGPDVVGAVRALYAPEQEPRAAALAPVASDCAYGPHLRNRLDLYREGEGGRLRPVLLFVHGGGFLAGDKGGDGNGNGGWANAHLGRWAAANGMLGAVMNYRLAPGEAWPAGAEDVAAAVTWLQEHAAEHGGDPERIVLLGTSAGSVHIAGFLKLRSDHAGMVRAAVLLSGLYGFTPLDERDMLYYGPQDAYAGRMPREAVVETALPLLLACAEFDPPRFQAEWAGLLQARLDRHGCLPRAHYASGHNHYSMAMHLGTADRRLSDEILTFISAHS